jgi:hypothetical protein
VNHHIQKTSKGHAHQCRNDQPKVVMRLKEKKHRRSGANSCRDFKTIHEAQFLQIIAKAGVISLKQSSALALRKAANLSPRW